MSFALAGCAGQAATLTVRPTVNPSDLYGAGASDEPSSAPASTTYEAKVGELVDLSCDGVDCLHVTISKVASASVYRSSTYGDDTPTVKGDVFIAAYVTYTAVGANASYNPFDWQIFVDDTAAGDPETPLAGPMPPLDSGSLPVGKSAKGWIIWEVPAKGKVVLSYGGNSSNPPAFEVTIRAK